MRFLYKTSASLAQASNEKESTSSPPASHHPTPSLHSLQRVPHQSANAISISCSQQPPAQIPRRQIRHPNSPPNKDSPPDDSPPLPLCEICSLPLSSTTTKPPHPHEASLAHQVCLKHSHPPSNLDRSRLGLRYLQSQGWDPDSRLGLGAQSQGIQFPIKAKPKDDKMGLGLVFPREKGAGIVKKDVKEKLDAGKVRKLEERDRRKREKLQELFYRSEDLDRYLGSG